MFLISFDNFPSFFNSASNDNAHLLDSESGAHISDYEPDGWSHLFRHDRRDDLMMIMMRLEVNPLANHNNYINILDQRRGDDAPPVRLPLLLL